MDSSARSDARRAAHHRPGWPLLAVLGCGVVLVVVAFFVIANPFGGAGSADRVSYTEAVVGAPSRVNPLFAHLSDADRDLAALVFSGLVKLDKDGRPLPDLAETWSTSGDGKEVTFTLRDDVTWHSGVPFSADDVVFTFGLLANPDLPTDPEQKSLWQSVSCSAPNPLTVACTLQEPYAPFVTYAAMGILPRHLLEAVPAKEIADDPFNSRPIGTGPYRLDGLSPDSAILHAYDGFYLGRPSIDELRLDFYPDIASAAAGLVRGNTQGLLVDLTINPSDFQTLMDVPGVSPYSAARSAHTDLFLNNTAAPLNDPAVRQAIARAVDVDSIITGLLGGRGVRVDTPIVPGSWAYDPDVSPPAHDIGEARQILEEAGWNLSGGEPVRRKNDAELRITLMTDQDPLRGAVADLVAEQLKDIGMDTTVVQQPSNDLVREFLIPRQYQAAVFGLDPGPDPDPYPSWHSSQALEGGRNLTGYADDEADRLMEEARVADNVEQRTALYSQFQQQFLNDAASIPLYSQLYVYFVSSRIQNVDPGLLFWPSSRFRNISDWTVTGSDQIGG